jgi:hypothetical protein
LADREECEREEEQRRHCGDVEAQGLTPVVAGVLA